MQHLPELAALAILPRAAKPAIRTLFAEELAKNGLTPKMDAAYAAELVELPPKVA